MTDMYYPVHAQGLYEALVQAKEYKVPVYITETGCADRSDAVRPVMIDQYVRATLRAMRDGADVRGFYYWVRFLILFCSVVC
jgi:beta-glucosidase/6-phospho-beta-glucosidase/beta-galactosidase